MTAPVMVHWDAVEPRRAQGGPMSGSSADRGRARGTTSSTAHARARSASGGLAVLTRSEPCEYCDGEGED